MRGLLAIPELTARQWRVLLLVSSATFFDYYDITIISLALKQIQTDLLIREENLGLIGAVIQFGKIPAVFVALAADRFGRRPVLLVTVIAYTILTGLSGLAPEAISFMLFQFLARTFATAELALAHVVIAEEVDKSHRGWAIGLMGTLAGFGSGLAYVLFGFIDQFPGGWRMLYFIGIAPLILLIFLRRSLPETARFHRAVSGDEVKPDVSLAFRLQPLLYLVRRYPGRLLAVGAATFLFAYTQEPTYFFAPKFLQEEHGWKPHYIALLAPFGIITVFMSVAGGWMGDRFGRRRITIIFLILTAGSALMLFQGSGFVALAVAMVGAGACSAVARINLFVYGAELFPTVSRATAGGTLMVANSLGGLTGLALESYLFRKTGSHALGLSILVAGLLPAVVALLFLTETSLRSLEELAGEQ